jgi:hypothetical protein
VYGGPPTPLPDPDPAAKSRSCHDLAGGNRKHVISVYLVQVD